MFKPDVIAFDFETSLDGKGSLLFFHPDFRVDSCAFSWYIKGKLKNRFIIGESEINKQLQIIEKQGIPLIAHGAQFELGCMSNRFPDINLDTIKYDTMRLVQVFDGGGSRHVDTKPMTLEEQIADLEGTKAKVPQYTGLSLQAAVGRLLPSVHHDHKEPFYKYLREEKGVKKGKEGGNLTLLPLDMLKEYNVADTDLTLLLYYHLKDKIGYDWSFDHALHLSACKRINSFKTRGVRVDTELLAGNIEIIKTEIRDIKSDFYRTYEGHIRGIERLRTRRYILGVKTLRGQKKRLQAYKDGKDSALKLIHFNPGSTKQLSELFVGVLGVKPTFWTKPQKNRTSEKEFVPSPSFRAVHLSSYGEGGSKLEGLKRRGLVLKQCQNLKILSEYDSRWHWSLFAPGTKTNRFTGSSDGNVKLNAQGLARRDELLMKCIVADDGMEIASIDLTQGEPSFTAHYSSDVNYHLLNFGMIGKTPYYNKDGMLILDDQYLSGASVHPVYRDKILEAWDKDYNGNTFAQQWTIDKEVIKKDLKTIRAACKTAILALQYGQGSRGLVTSSYDAGFDLSFKDAKMFHNKFWNVMFPGVRDLGIKLKHAHDKGEMIITEFGFKLSPETSFKALNYFVQGTVSGIMKLFEEYYYSRNSQSFPMPTIHDELLMTYPIEHREQVKADIDWAIDQVNNQLGWKIRIRAGFACGKDLFSAK